MISIIPTGVIIWTIQTRPSMSSISTVIALGDHIYAFRVPFSMGLGASNFADTTITRAKFEAKEATC
jgi:hypothetical protein